MMKKNVTKLAAGALAGSILFSAAACGKKNKSGGADLKVQYGNVAIGGGGYIPGIVYNKGEAGLAYCRTDIGGAYRRRSGETDWVPITDHLGGVGSDNWNLIGIESIASDPVEPKRVYLSCGTYTGTNGAILVSDDYGESWNQVDMPFPMGGNTSGRGVGERLMVNPANNQQIFCGSRSDGLYVSSDYGKTWEKNTALPSEGDYYQEKNQIGVMWVEFAPEGNEMFVGVANQNGECIYRSSDAGKSFTALPANLPGMYPLRAEISPNGYLYLCYSDSCGPNAAVKNGAVYRYSLKDNRFEDITPDCNDGRYGGFSGISVDGSNPDTIVCGTLGFWSEKGENLYRSTDGGKSWTALFTNDRSDYVMDVSEAQWLSWGREQAQTGWWTADVEIDPFNSDVVTWGTGATLYSTRNMTALGSGTPVTVAFDAKGIEETAVFKVVSAPSEDGGPELYSIMGDLTGFSHLDTAKRPDDAHFMKNGTAVDLAVAWQNSKIAAYTNDSKKNTITYTTDGGQTWQSVPKRPETKPGGTISLNADGSILTWIPGSLASAAYFTKDFGGSWYIAGGLGLGSVIYADKLDPNVFYATCGGQIYVSKNGCVSFEATGLSVGDNSELVPSAEKAGALWIRSGTSLYYSEDFGVTSEYIKDVSATAIGVGTGKKSGDPMVLYFMGEAGKRGGGIYMTADHGKTIKKLTSQKDGFGNITPSITGDASTYGKFYFATNGRGIILGQIQN